jgi:glyoxylase-like metal-dependent hydrolase (beta-lactamase superfamily II)
MSDAVRLPAGVTVLERGWLSSNNIVFTSGATAVVDTGYATHSEQTVALVRRELGGRPLELVVNTHLHSDHCGGNSALQAAYPSTRLLIPPGHADAVARWDESVLTYRATGQNCTRFRFDGVLAPGESIRLGDSDWEIHSAPGHDPHSVVLFEPGSRLLISADALWENGFGVVFPELDGDSAFDEVGATLDLIESLRAEALIPGHGTPFAGRDRIRDALARARSRLASFTADPRRHASHGMKVLIKFKLLEWQSLPFEELARWAESMPYMRAVHSRFFPELPLRSWLENITAELVKSHALGRDGAMIYNI